MAKGFSEQEKHVIRDKLYEEGKALFSQYGLKKTSISQITKAVGIAQGSFYLFFTSKEELYFDILEQEEAEMKAELLPLLSSGMTPDILKEILLIGLKQFEERPFFKNMLMGDDMEVLMRKLPADRLHAHITNDQDAFYPFIQKWKQEGILKEGKPDVIVGMIRAFFTIILHKKEIGEDIYPETAELLADCIANGIIVSKGE
ncbi:TetR/AcrR family transcriptional regulator [Bacillus sp. HMF5848]|nr:TetR/AcrR family transcriptional regulator [Bacillus sp. HMF5848]